MYRQKYINGLRKLGQTGEVPNITKENQEYLLRLIKSRKSKYLLEIGSANGLSSIIFGDYLEKINGKITTIEFSHLSVIHARNNINAAGLTNTIDVIEGNALDVLRDLKQKKQQYDFIFIDGMKRRSLDFLQLSTPLLAQGGVIVIDDVIKFKNKMPSLYQYIEENAIKHEIVQTDPDDGIMILEYENLNNKKDQ